MNTNILELSSYAHRRVGQWKEKANGSNGKNQKVPQASWGDAGTLLLGRARSRRGRCLSLFHGLWPEKNIPLHVARGTMMGM